MVNRSVFFSFLAICFFASGCVSESSDGSTKIFKFELWLIASLALLSISAAVGGWFLRRLKQSIGWVVVAAGPLFLVLVLPGMYMEHVAVSPEKVTRVGGFWFSQSTQEISLEEVIDIRLIMKETRGRRRRKKKNYYIVFQSRDRESVEIALGEIMEVATVEIRKQANDRGIPFRDLTSN
ncbi:hypothetical protein OAE37_01500 [Pirellulaceae bacterium]|nr:hypothetical protein [Pirellulaceae bacterium]